MKLQQLLKKFKTSQKSSKKKDAQHDAVLQNGKEQFVALIRKGLGVPVVLL